MFSARCRAIVSLIDDGWGVGFCCYHLGCGGWFPVPGRGWFCVEVALGVPAALGDQGGRCDFGFDSFGDGSADRRRRQGR